jgi:hypothetical protein
MMQHGSVARDPALGWFEPSRLFVVDLDSTASLDEARALGFPPAPGGAA